MSKFGSSFVGEQHYFTSIIGLAIEAVLWGPPTHNGTIIWFKKWGIKISEITYA